MELGLLDLNLLVQCSRGRWVRKGSNPMNSPNAKLTVPWCRLLLAAVALAADDDNSSCTPGG